MGVGGEGGRLCWDLYGGCTGCSSGQLGLCSGKGLRGFWWGGLSPAGAARLQAAQSHQLPLPPGKASGGAATGRGRRLGVGPPEARVPFTTFQSPSALSL